MAKAFDFPGGVHPPARKARSRQVPLRQAPLPRRVVLPLDQHIGAPSEPCVTVGQRVRTGEPVALAQGLISADLHASISGTVTAIEARPVPQSSEAERPCVVIEGDGATDDWAPMPPLDWRRADDATLLERLARSGVVGLGGAGFPTQIKARVRERHAIDTLVVNAAECEPYITADDLTLRHHAGEVLEGARLLARLSGAGRILVGIEDDKPEAIDALKAALTADEAPAIEVRVIASRYPSGGEKQLIKRLLDREVPSGGLPADVGVLCHNPGTLRAALMAVRDGRPLVSRVVTLTGETLARPGNVEARLGTPMNELLAFAGLGDTEPAHLVMGGPMMGIELARFDLPLVKASNCLIAATSDELPAPPPEQPCIRCGACEEACPAALLPQQLHWFAKAREHDKAELFHLFDCIECGACAYVCPSEIPLVHYYRKAKAEIRNIAREKAKAEIARERFEARNERLEREKEERLERHRKAAEARKQAQAEQVKAGGDNPQDAVQAAIARAKARKAAQQKAAAEQQSSDEDNNS